MVAVGSSGGGSGGGGSGGGSGGDGSGGYSLVFAHFLMSRESMSSSTIFFFSSEDSLSGSRSSAANCGSKKNILIFDLIFFLIFTALRDFRLVIVKAAYMRCFWSFSFVPKVNEGKLYTF